MRSWTIRKKRFDLLHKFEKNKKKEITVDANERDFNTFHLKYQLVAHIGMMEKNSNRRISFTSSTMMCAPPSLFCPCNALSMHQQL